MIYKDGDVILKGFRNSDMYQIELYKAIVYAITSSSFIQSNDLNIWYLSLGHIGYDKINKMIK